MILALGLHEDALDLAVKCMDQKARYTAFESRWDARAKALPAKYVKKQQLLRARHDEELKRLKAAMPAISHLFDVVCKQAAKPQGGKALDPIGGKAVAPEGGNAFNTFPPFRVLVWNLENFTRDSRPRGAEPIGSRRNQARIGAVVTTMQKLDVDLLLLMETGGDVGEATTQIASRLVKAGGMWHELVSTATHARPALKDQYLVTIGRPTATRARALATLADWYSVTASGSAPATTEPQILEALKLLPDVLPGVADLGVDLADAFEFATCEGDLSDALRYVAGWAVDAAETEVDAADSRAQLKQLLGGGDDVLEFIKGFLENGKVDTIPRTVAAFQATELLMLFERKCLREYEARERGDEDGPDLSDFDSDKFARAVQPPLMVFFCTGIQKVELLFREAKALDEDVLFERLRQIGAVTFHSETYGMVYRPPDGEQSMNQFFTSPSVWSGNGMDPWRVYDIIKRNADGTVLDIQGGVLNWRSALRVSFPMKGGTCLPLALYHTRFSGSAAINDLDPRLTATENTVLARCMSVAEVARAAVMAAAYAHPLPLIVGDFNIPTAYLQEVPGDGARVAERKAIVRNEFRDEMASYGYVRHSSESSRSGFPLTTLAGNANLARGVVYSQAYDGVYAPVTGVGGALVRSGAVLIDEVMTDAMLNVEVTVPKGVDLNEIVDVEDETDDGPADDQPGEVEMVDAQQGTETIRIGVIFAERLERVYNSFLEQVVKEIVKRRTWLGDARRDAVAGPILKTYEKFGLTRIARREWFYGCCWPAPRWVSYAAAGNDDVLATLAADFTTASKRHDVGHDHVTYATLAKILENVSSQLQGMETNPVARVAIAYRAIVSDHIPMLIQIEP